jgi:hypothetical protein
MSKHQILKTFDPIFKPPLLFGCSNRIRNVSSDRWQGFNSGYICLNSFRSAGSLWKWFLRFIHGLRLWFLPVSAIHYTTILNWRNSILSGQECSLQRCFPYVVAPRRLGDLAFRPRSFVTINARRYERRSLALRPFHMGTPRGHWPFKHIPDSILTTSYQDDEAQNQWINQARFRRR